MTANHTGLIAPPIPDRDFVTGIFRRITAPGTSEATINYLTDDCLNRNRALRLRPTTFISSRSPTTEPETAA